MLPAVKLVVAIVHSEDAGVLVDALLARDFRATRLHSSGGFLKQSNTTVILGVEDDEVDEVMGIVRESCHSRTQIVNPMPPIMEPGEFFMPYPLEVEVGGATVFVVPVERFERLLRLCGGHAQHARDDDDGDAVQCFSTHSHLADGYRRHNRCRASRCP